jgi:hypothetical protein
MYFSLKDAAGRDLMPNRASPGAVGGGGAQPYGDGGAQAYDEYPSYAAPVDAPQMNPHSPPSNCGSCSDPRGNGYEQMYSTQQPQQPQQQYGQQQFGGGQGQNFQQFQNQQPVFYQEVVNTMNQGQNQLGNRIQHLSSVHASLNQKIVQALRKNILKISRELGVPPSWVDLSPDGGAVWKYSHMVKGKSIWCRVFNRVEVTADRKATKEPLPHIGAITTTTKIKLDCDIVKSLQRDLPQVSYCPSTKRLQITTDTLDHNLSVLALICGCQQKKLSLNKLRYYKLPQKYFRLTTPGDKRYRRGAKYALIKFIQS